MLKINALCEFRDQIQLREVLERVDHLVDEFVGAGHQETELVEHGAHPSEVEQAFP